MALISVELRNLLKTNFELFDFEYQFDDQNFKAELEQAVIDYFYFREIGRETPDAFKHMFKSKWLRIIPYYNKLHNTSLLSYNPLTNYNIKEGLNQLAQTSNNQDGKTTSSANGSTTSNTSTNTITDTTGNTLTTDNTQTTTSGSTDSNSEEVASDYPQQDINDGDYLHGARTSQATSSNDSTSKNTGTVNVDNSSNSQGTTESTGATTSQDDGTVTNELVSRGTTNTEYEKTIEGITGYTYQDLISKERENLLRIQDMVINEMKTCFTLIYS